MLKLRFKNNKHNTVWLVEPKVTIGRAIGNDLVIDDPGLAAQHAEILVKHEELKLVNMAGRGVLVNDKPVEASAILNVDDLLQFGETQLEVVDPKQEYSGPRALGITGENSGWALKSNHAALANRVFPIKGETVIGRSRECDITLGAAHLSRRHAKLVMENGQLYARDLGSANGTFLNGERINEARVRRGDELRFDTLSFGVIGPSSEDLDKTSIRPLSAVKPSPNPGKSTASASKAARSTHVQRPAGAAVRGERNAVPGRAAAEHGEGSGNTKLAWALGWGLLLAVALAAGLAWQQGLMGP